jgi:diaminohydroxyphosphoribosylaminopyrimidine deaminase/5-amino-6-(5-phosphoribosylamino)uracil reductase
MTNSDYMLEALALAERAWGRTSPNPMVGAVIVKGSEIIGRGFHEKAGLPHAEVNALKDAGENARSADIYVTLEPCSTTGRTPPCTEAIIKAGIKKVFIGSLDPNPKHAGAGVDILRAAGIEVVSGIEEEKCGKLNEAFFKWIINKKPFVILKMAMTLDGKIATAGGDSKWVTGPVARGRVQKLRQWCDAIMVGGETVRKDHPSLNVREPDDWSCQPRRFVASNTLSEKELHELMPEGLKPELARLSSEKDWKEFLTKLGSENITALLIEGGGELAASALRAGAVDKVEFHIAPKILGGRNSRAVVGGSDPLSLAESLELKDVSIEQLGADISISGYLP